MSASVPRTARSTAWKATFLVAAALVVAAAGYLLLGTIRWQEAYQALGVVDPGPHALALAMADGDVPEGISQGARVHAPGSLLRIRVDEFDATGERVARNEVRVLVPPLPYIGADAPGTDLAELACLDRCRAQLSETGAVPIVRSGKVGVAEEWLLRMPVGQSFSLGDAAITLQDIEAAEPTQLSRRRLRISVLEACRASVRIGSETHVEYLQAAIPVPRALRTTQWVQLEGCAAMLQAPAQLQSVAAVRTPPVQLRRAWQERADWESVRPMQSGGMKWAALMVDEEWLAQGSQPRVFHLLRACQYDVPSRRWLPLPAPEGDAEIALRGQPSPVQRLAYRFPRENALFFAEWTERVDGVDGPTHRIVMPGGSDSCRDLPLQAAPPGEVPACVPSGVLSDRMLVPDPQLHCAAGN